MPFFAAYRHSNDEPYEAIIIETENKQEALQVLKYESGGGYTLQHGMRQVDEEEAQELAEYFGVERGDGA